MMPKQQTYTYMITGSSVFKDIMVQEDGETN